MAGKIPDLELTPRAGTGKGAARQARRDGLVPGVVYGGGEEPQAITIPFNILFKKLKDGGFMSTLFNLKVEGSDDVRAVCRGVQRHVVKDLPTHIDFLRLKRDSRINMNIPVHFLNEETSAGLKKGGTLTIVRAEVELMVTAGNIPDYIEADLENLEIGETINISDITLPEDTRPVIADRDFVIANIAAPGGAADDEDEDVAEGETPEGEAPEADSEA
ncbi:MAG: 50S ribosomal protein L25/general stress protein Ctc [Rhodobacterales bacterium]|jgi:large subunit ribosomal protein L25|nr:50S ribosomal protein L25/general stress protein Ctc [Rhodobacterales bacterium]MBT7560214.1 50S ribosomal protein L25/general stress protein Ctc [Rhodobacterales bacterium]MDB2464826.1 50S ribosomal protein L25/general stress protein Ctc [Amylibacter sp.]MDB3882143.1 50S ribosomal protein L25/general stress protein Ctc [Amylibacter sp.]